MFSEMKSYSWIFFSWILPFRSGWMIWINMFRQFSHLLHDFFSQFETTAFVINQIETDTTIMVKLLLKSGRGVRHNHLSHYANVAKTWEFFYSICDFLWSTVSIGLDIHNFVWEPSKQYMIDSWIQKANLHLLIDPIYSFSLIPDSNNLNHKCIAF